MSVNRYSSVGKKIRPWDVDRILDKKIVGGKPRYLVKWRRTFSELNTWELGESFLEPSLIIKFETELQRSQQSVRRSSLAHRLSENISRRLEPAPTGARSNSVVEESKATTTVVEKCPTMEDKRDQDSRKVEIFKNLMETELQCCICHDVFQNPCVTDCEHIFCDNCIEKWKSLNRTCPICRSVLFRSEKKLQRIDNFITKAAKVLNN